MIPNISLPESKLYPFPLFLLSLLFPPITIAFLTSLDSFSASPVSDVDGVIVAASPGVVGVPGIDPPPQLRRNFPPIPRFFSLSAIDVAVGDPGIISPETGSQIGEGSGRASVPRETEEGGRGDVADEVVELEDVKAEIRLGKGIGIGNLLPLGVALVGDGTIGE